MDIVEHHNNTITKSARNPLTSLLPASLPPASLLPAFLPPTSLPPIFKPLIFPPTAFKKFNYRRASVFLKRQADKIAVQNVKYKIAFKSYVLAILF